MTDYQEVRTTEHEQGSEQRFRTFKSHTTNLAAVGSA